jgi:hypothetical protein
MKHAYTKFIEPHLQMVRVLMFHMCLMRGHFQLMLVCNHFFVFLYQLFAFFGRYAVSTT